MIASPAPTSCMVFPIEGSTLPTVFSSLFLACSISTILEASTVCISTQMWPESKVSRVQGEVEHPETVFDLYIPVQCDFKCYKLVYSLFM